MRKNMDAVYPRNERFISGRLLSISIAFVVLALTLVTGCNSQSRTEALPIKKETAQPQPKPEELSLLCERLKEIKMLPLKDEPGDDPVFKELTAAGDDVVPCLIRKITDETEMPDPRQAPRVGAVSVGDVAFFSIYHLGKASFEELFELLPPEVQKAYTSDEGVYGYFRTIDKHNNRKKFQVALTKWYEKKYGRSLPPQ
jgi:hypothetical protein